ncbi:uncharacterized protein LOC110029751 [Phalaenopsis equestris]|uniref:uncharacterized protein LOC110029751 n=1 Tax=Phalaenopsis equestris TaxID=78828 RepID=UPI0009E5E164|nr:uncharacterized protein LOC110029751 [Phalaenopsis equestris]
MAEGVNQKHCEIMLGSGDDDHDEDCELCNLPSISDDESDEYLFSEEDDEICFSSYSLNSSAGPLCDLSSIMADLPIKRGLSKFFEGKSKSFSSISEAKCIEDLAKKEHPYNKRMKFYKRNENSYMNQKPYNAPNQSSRVILKNAQRNCCVSMLGRSRSSSFFYKNKASPISMQKNCLYVLIKEQQEG